MKARIFLASIIVILTIGSPQPIVCNATSVHTGNPDVQVVIFVRSIEKVDLSESTFRIDFYLIIHADLTEVFLDQLIPFEFVNGEPTTRIIARARY